MAKLNPNFGKLAAGYLFPEIARRTKAYVEANPDARVMRLGIGNTTEPLTPIVIKGLHGAVDRLAHADTYSGYGDEQGMTSLREAIVNSYGAHGAEIHPEEVFISDGAKCDSANIQEIFSNDAVVAVQDPAYPVYVESNVIAGRTGPFNRETGQYDGLVYMVCNAENGFIPGVPCDPNSPAGFTPDLIYLCFPNNPTGAVATHKQLEEHVNYAEEAGAVIIFDAAYSAFIKDPSLPRSIFEVDGARRRAIEINSLSKSHGFTGVRVGHTIVPKDLIVGDGEPGEANYTWNRRQCTKFNGASNVTQPGALAGLTEQGLIESQGLVDYYMENAQIIRKGLVEVGLPTVSGGDNAPYLWVPTPKGVGSWDFFNKFLTEANVVVTPGAGFGRSGEGYIRVSPFGHREDVKEAVDSFKQNLKL
tara:strand:- start:2995 stop:4248 length:1254 start_codon:yes stop_codon:yes gene_type:complete